MLKRLGATAVMAVLPLAAACGAGGSAPASAAGVDQPGTAAASARPAGQAAYGGVEAPGAPPETAVETRNPSANMVDSVTEYRELTIPAGTVLPVELATAVTSESSSIEDPVRASLRAPIVIDGHEALASGSTLTGVVTDVQRSGRVKGRAHVALRFNSLDAGDERMDIRTGTIARTAPGTKKEDAKKIGIGAGAGAIIGGIIGGGSGAAKGAAIGGAGGTGVVLATRGEEVSLPRGTSLSVKLLEPVTVTVELKR